jgi:PKD repeat protein
MRRVNMKKVIFSLVVVMALIIMMLPADIAVARSHRDRDNTATNETQTETTQTADDELESVISLAGLVAPPSEWPDESEWIGLADDPDEGGGKDHRDVFDTDVDDYALYYYVDSDYIFLRMETVDTPGWPSTSQSDEARYKWWFHTEGTPAYIHGTTVENAEFLMILEDLTDNSIDPDGTKDLLGEMTLMDDLNNDGFMKRWDSSNPPNYTINNAQTDPAGSSPWWRRVLGNGTPGAGGPQEVMGWDIGYRIDTAETGGNFVDMYVSRAALDNPSSICLIWATDNLNPNLDQAPNLDRPVAESCIMLGKDYGDAPASYPTLMTNDGARHTIGEFYLGTDIDAELDGIPSLDAMGDDNDSVDDEDGIVFTTALIKGQSADVTVTASDTGYLDAWMDFNADGDWADAGEQIFTSESLSAGSNGLTFDVPFSAQSGDTFARFRFSSAGGLSYDGLADDGEVEDYMVAIEGCTLTVELWGDNDFCEGDDRTITAIVYDATPPYTYDWSASTASGTANDGTYTATGSGTVEVTVTDYYGCTGSDSIEVTALQGPTADFTSDVQSCCNPLTVQFTDESVAGDNPIDTWEWDFGDGDTSTAQNPSHTYDTPGTYTVTLTVTDEHGCSDEETKEAYITSNEGPTADFTSDVQSCCNPLTVQFTDESVAGDNPIDTWEWDFGDGDTSTAQNPSHMYDTPGTYTVTLTVTDEHGCSDEETKEAYITSNEGPTADFTSDVQSCCNPLTVQFTDESVAGDNPIDTWEWDFGDGDTSTAQNPSHTYDTPGTYTVTLTVTDEHGCSDEETKEAYITSNEGPTADFTSDVQSCCNPLTVQFTDESVAGDNPIDTWEWDFGDGDTSTAQNPSHMYDTPGTYTVTLTVTDEHGCSDEETKEAYITSNEGPTAAFSADPTSGYAPLMVQFTDESVAGDNPIVSWEWDFGDVDTSSAQNPSHIYGSTGTYIVTLTVTDEHGCVDDATTTIVVTIPITPPTTCSCCYECGLTVDWEGNITTKPLYCSNDKLAVDCLGPSFDLSHNLFLEKGTHAPVVYTMTHYVIVVREVEETPATPENMEAIVVFNITPADATFDKDIFLTLGVDELPANAINVTMAYYDDINEVWELMESEAGGPSGVAELTLSAPINHFSIYGVLAEFEQTTPQQPAHFVASGLNIEPTVEKLSVFVTKTGGSVTITANVVNDGGQGDIYTAELKLNGETVDTKTVTLGAGQSKQVSFTVSELDYGQYEVEVAGLTDTFTTSRTITWWLILVIIVAVGLIIWGVVWGTRRRRKAQLEA